MRKAWQSVLVPSTVAGCDVDPTHCAIATLLFIADASLLFIVVHVDVTVGAVCVVRCGHRVQCPRVG